MAAIPHIFLTGPPGIGKTTLIQKIYKNLKTQNVEIRGFYTEERRERGTRIGFDIIDLEGNCQPLARITSQTNDRSPKVGKYSVDIQAFESVALPVFDDITSSTVLILDEIGKMELFSSKFKEKVQLVFKNPHSPRILATIPVRPIPFVDSLRKLTTAKIFTVSVQNRDDLEKEIMAAILTSPVQKQP